MWVRKTHEDDSALVVFNAEEKERWTHQVKQWCSETFTEIMCILELTAVNLNVSCPNWRQTDSQSRICGTDPLLLATNKNHLQYKIILLFLLVCYCVPLTCRIQDFLRLHTHCNILSMFIYYYSDYYNSYYYWSWQCCFLTWFFLHSHSLHLSFFHLTLKIIHKYTNRTE